MSSERAFLPSFKRYIAAYTIVVALVLTAVCGRAMEWLGAAIPTTVYRNTASLEESFLHVKLAAGLSPQAAVDELQADLKTYINNPILFLLNEKGEVEHVAGTCNLVRRSEPLETLSPYLERGIVHYPYSHVSLCREKESRLSGAISRAAGSTRYLLIARADEPFGSYLSTSSHVLHLIQWVGLPLLFFFAWAVGTYTLFRHLSLSHIGLITSQARSFAAGDFSTRFDPGEFPEYASLAHTFNTLATEVSSRLNRLVRDADERRELVAGLAHDLRTPMTAIEGCVALLGKAELPSERQAVYREMIRRSSEQERTLSHELEELSSLQGPPSESMLISSDAVRIAHEAIHLAQPIADLKKITLVSKSSRDSIPILAEPLLLRRALLNLLDNALRHTPEGGMVTVDVTVAGELSAIFSVEDTGAGLPASGTDRALSRSGHTGSLRKRTGLGLTIVGKIAEMHGSSLNMVSGTTGGTRATFTVEPGAQQNRRSESHDLPLTPLVPARRVAWISEAILMITVLSSLGCILLSGESSIAIALTAIGSLALIANRSRRLLRRVLLPECTAFVCFIASAAWEPNHTACTFLGWTCISLALVMIRRAERLPLVIQLGIIIAAFGIASLTVPRPKWTFFLGCLAGLMLSGFSIGTENSKSLRRAGVWPSAILLLGCTFASILIGAAEYGYSFSMLEKVANREGPRIFQSILPKSSQAPLNSEQRSTFEETLSRAFFLDPLHDFYTPESPQQPFDSSPVGLSYGGSTPDEIATLPETDTLQFLTWAFGRSVVSYAGCSDPACIRLRIASPSQRAIGVMGRLFNSVLFVSLWTELLIAGLLAWLLTLRFRSILDRRFKALEDGLQRYRQGDYQQRLPIAKEDEFGELAAVLDELAQRIPTLEAEILSRQRELRIFLLRAAAAVREKASSVVASIPPGNEQISATLPILEARSSGLRKTIEAVFEIAYMERDKSVPESDELFLAELLHEEVERFQSRGAHGRRIEPLFDDSSWRVSAPGELLIRAIRLLFERAAREAPAEHDLALSLRRLDGMACELEIGPANVNDRSSGIEEQSLRLSEERAADLDEYLLELIFRRLKPSGVSLKIFSTSGDILRYVITFGIFEQKSAENVAKNH